jgi:hypothetical protein
MVRLVSTKNGRDVRPIYCPQLLHAVTEENSNNLDQHIVGRIQVPPRSTETRLSTCLAHRILTELTIKQQ